MEDALSLTFSALADPTRRAILLRLADGEATVNDLAAPFSLKLPTVSKHLRVLQRAGLISQGRKAQWRPCRLEAAPLKEVAEWAERFRANYERQFDRLDDYLSELQAREPQHAKKGKDEHDKSTGRPHAQRKPRQGRSKPTGQAKLAVRSRDRNHS